MARTNVPTRPRSARAPARPPSIRAVRCLFRPDPDRPGRGEWIFWCEDGDAEAALKRWVGGGLPKLEPRRVEVIVPARAGADWEIRTVDARALDLLPGLSLLSRVEATPDPLQRVVVPSDSIVAWSHAAKFALELVAAGRFLPSIEAIEEAGNGAGTPGRYWATWAVVLGRDEDRERFRRLARAMPACAYAWPDDRDDEAERPEDVEPAIDDADDLADPGEADDPESDAAPPFIEGNGLGAGATASASGDPDTDDADTGDANTDDDDADDEPRFTDPGALLRDFLDAAADTLFRISAAQSASRVRAAPRDAPAWVGRWLTALTGPDPSFAPQGLPERHVPDELWAWSLHALGAGAEAPFRVLFHLTRPPDAEPEDAPWRLEYLLQSADDPAQVLPLAAVWSIKSGHARLFGKVVREPHDTVLRALGEAARAFPPIESSLRRPRPSHVNLRAGGAWLFIKNSAPLLQLMGQGVRIPVELDQGGERRLHAQLEVSGALHGGNGTGRATRAEDAPVIDWQSPARFRWQVVLDSHVLPPAEFRSLTRNKRAITRWNDRWVCIDPADLATLAKVVHGGPKGTGSLAEALALSLRGTAPLGPGLPEVPVVALGELQALVAALRARENVEASPPASFRGELRPYQARGLSWLQDMHQHGLGGILADDMGLGKCLRGDAGVFVNGAIIRAEELWETQAGPSTSDGEGEWAAPRGTLVVNAIDESTGAVRLARVRRLYRQRVREPLRRITLDDGSTVTITHRHQLRGRDGWTRALAVGDHVAVPARLRWLGRSVDPAVTEFLAWQIAEGHEPGEGGTLSITQMDRRVLERLRRCARAIERRLGVRMNRCGIHQYGSRPSYLALTSVAYRRFLESRGYRWGERSAGKSIPDFIVAADRATLRLFLRHYFDAEGSVVASMRSIEISSASRLLMQQLNMMLRRFGIWLRVKAKRKRATNGRRIHRTYWVGTLGGESARRFRDEIGFGDAEKQRKLVAICRVAANTNVEGIPASDIVADLWRRSGLSLRRLGVPTNVYVDGSQGFSATSLQRVRARLDAVLSGEMAAEFATERGNRWTARTRAALAALDRPWLESQRHRLARLLEEEVHWCRVERIEEIDHDGWVYDLEIERHHNFVAEGVCCHNTVELLALLDHVRVTEAPELPSIVICPTSVLGNWQREAARFAPALRVYRHHGPDRAKSVGELTERVPAGALVMTTYTTARLDADVLARMRWYSAVLDEAQNVKNPQAAQSEAVRELDAPRRFALTGTPVENRLDDLWSILDWCNPGLLGPLETFRRAVARPIERYRDPLAATRLRAMVQPFVLRRLKSDPEIAPDLPEKITATVACSLSAEQVRLYKKAVTDAWTEIRGRSGMQRRGRILALLTALKQICNHPAHFLKEEAATPNRAGKLARLLEMLEEVASEGDRALIFTQYVEMGHLLVARLEQAFGWEVPFLHGGVPARARDVMVERFQEDAEAAPVFVLSLKAGGTGLNLTRANHVFHYDQWWNPAVEDQATDRTHRIGQTQTVYVHRLVSTGTLEEKISEMLDAKRGLAEIAVGVGEQWLTELGDDELRALVDLSADAVVLGEDA